MPTILNINSQDYGLPFALPGKGLVLKCKNKGLIGNVSVLKGVLVDSRLSQGNLNQVDNILDLPFRMFYNNQDYSQTVNPLFNNYQNEWIPQMNCLLAMPGNTIDLINNLQFTSKFDLKPQSTSSDEFVFNVYFFPYYMGDYVAELKITWRDNVTQVDQYTRLIIKGSMIGKISEIDKTQHHELVFEVDQVQGNNFFEIY